MYTFFQKKRKADKPEQNTSQESQELEASVELFEPIQPAKIDHPAENEFDISMLEYEEKVDEQADNSVSNILFQNFKS